MFDNVNKGVLFKNSLRVKSPIELSKNYFKTFIKSGGNFYKEICKFIHGPKFKQRKTN